MTCSPSNLFICSRQHQLKVEKRLKEIRRRNPLHKSIVGNFGCYEISATKKEKKNLYLDRWYRYVELYPTSPRIDPSWLCKCEVESSLPLHYKTCIPCIVCLINYHFHKYGVKILSHFRIFLMLSINVTKAELFFCIIEIEFSHSYGWFAIY